VTFVPSPTASYPTYPESSLLINEVAWAGTIASSSDEWIELFNPGSEAIELEGWLLMDGGDIRVSLAGIIAPHGYFLLERTDDSTIADLSAHQLYKGSLRNDGEALWLKDPSGKTIDSVNGGGGAWPAGNASTRASMERRTGLGGWGTFTGVAPSGHDAAGNPIRGTPLKKNSVLLPPPTATPSLESTPTPTNTADVEATPTSFAPQSVLINELAWAGTLASSSDEWIELHNPGDVPIDLEGWILSDKDDIHIPLTGIIPARGYFLLERTDDSTIANLSADLIYNGTLSNQGETLWLTDPSGVEVDSANGNGGEWPAGKASTRASMERHTGSAGWGTFAGHHGNGLDARGNPIQGTPGNKNSLLLPKPPPMWFPGKVRINEVLIRPHYDWEGKGGVNTGDEFIELYNLGPGTVFLKGWILDDIPYGGSKPYVIPGITLRPGSFVALFHTKTKISLNDDGDTIRLMMPDGNLVDQISYLKVRAYNLSFGRFPDGSGHLKYGLWPTPNESNEIFIETDNFKGIDYPQLCPIPNRPRTHLLRHARHPAQVRWLMASGYGICN
jgi:hypothetical protein